MNKLILLRENGVLKTLVLDKKVETSKGSIRLFSVIKDAMPTEAVSSTNIFKEERAHG